MCGLVDGGGKSGRPMAAPGGSIQSFLSSHCEPVTDVTGVAIRIPRNVRIIDMIRERIATPACALVRNDMRYMKVRKVIQKRPHPPAAAGTFPSQGKAWGC